MQSTPQGTASNEVTEWNLRCVGGLLKEAGIAEGGSGQGRK